MRNFLLFPLLVLALTSPAQGNRLDKFCKPHRPSPLAQKAFFQQAQTFLKPTEFSRIRTVIVSKKILDRKVRNQETNPTPLEQRELMNEGMGFQQKVQEDSPWEHKNWGRPAESFDPVLALRRRMQSDLNQLKDPLLRADYIHELKDQVRKRDINPDIIDELRDDIVEEEQLNTQSEEANARLAFQRSSQDRLARIVAHLDLEESCLGMFEKLATVRQSPRIKLKLQQLANCANTCTAEAVERILGASFEAAGGALILSKVTAGGVTAVAPVLTNPTLVIVGSAAWVAGRAFQEKANFRNCVSSCEQAQAQKEPQTQRESTTKGDDKEIKPPKQEVPSEQKTDPPEVEEERHPQEAQKSNPYMSLEAQLHFEKTLQNIEAKTLRSCLKKTPENQKNLELLNSETQHEKLKKWMNPFQMGKEIWQYKIAIENTNTLLLTPIQEAYKRNHRAQRQWSASSCESKTNFIKNGGLPQLDWLNEADLDCLCPKEEGA